MTAEPDRRASSGFVEAPLKYLANPEGFSAYVASVGGGNSSLHEGDHVMQPVARFTTAGPGPRASAWTGKASS